MTDCEPGRSDRAASSRVRYSRLSLFRPARGCNCEGSEKAEPRRNWSTPCASEGSKGVGEYDVVGVCVGADWSLGDDDCCDEEEDDDLRPVRVSQIDMATERREDLGWIYYK